jgi:MFS transporter, PAT family, beta-lactamase induction signal transducer AmpG
MTMRLPNLLASSRGRLAAFFLLYVTEGVPLGFAATAVATQLRRMGVGPAEIGAFVALFYLPWAFKWAFGPVIDVFRSKRFGHRRGWILFTQLGMVLSLLCLLPIGLPQGLALFTAVLFVHNLIAAAQDVAIDALAVNTLSQQERGLANGLMFAGASLGQAVGGAGVLWVMGFGGGLPSGIVTVVVTILMVTAFVVWPMKEALAGALASGVPELTQGQGQARGWGHALAEMREFVRQAFQSFLGSRASLAGVFFALLPAGAMALSLALQSNLAVELGMPDDDVALLALVSTITSGVCMVIGGWMADKLGMRRMLAVYTMLMSLPGLYLAWRLWQAGYAMPRPPGSPPLPLLIRELWVATIAFNVAIGLMYGTRTAVFMNITNPVVAGTQFTAYMAMYNLSISTTATWQGLAIEAWGYPITLIIDAAVGLLSLALLPWLWRASGAGLCDALAVRRAQRCGRALALVCVAFVVWWWMHDPKADFAPIASTGFTLAFVAAALFLTASGLLQAQAAAVQRALRWLAVGLLLLYLRRFVPQAPELLGAISALLGAAISAVALAAAAALWWVAGRPWPGLALSPSTDDPRPVTGTGPYAQAT